jgi:hypothetical protein
VLRREVCATRASAITLADSTERNICARANDSLQVCDRVASRLQCSVDRICTRSAADTSPRCVPGSGSDPLTGVWNRTFCASGSLAIAPPSPVRAAAAPISWIDDITPLLDRVPTRLLVHRVGGVRMVSWLKSRPLTRGEDGRQAVLIPESEDTVSRP